MIAGVPCVWLSPASAREQLKFSTLRAQKLTPLEASTPSELRAILEQLRDNEGERERIVDYDLPDFEPWVMTAIILTL